MTTTPLTPATGAPAIPSSPPAIICDHITKRFIGRRSTHTALKDVSFTVADGEFVCILGPSGCGKSTLLNILSGLDHEYEGCAKVFGVDIAQRGTLPRSGYIFQEPRLMPWRTVQQNVEYALHAAHFPSSEVCDRAREALELVGLGDFRTFHPLQLSGGMQQRASIARAFAVEPDVLYMDEPFSALDELTARRLRQELLNIWQEHRTTVVFVTHNAYEATFLSDRILIMKSGPESEFRDEISLDDLPRPRVNEDVTVFEKSQAVVRRLIAHVSDRD